MKVLFPICNLTWRVNIYVSRQGKGIDRRNEGTKNTTNIGTDGTKQLSYLPKTKLLHFLNYYKTIFINSVLETLLEIFTLFKYGNSED